MVVPSSYEPEKWQFGEQRSFNAQDAKVRLMAKVKAEQQEKATIKQKQ